MSAPAYATVPQPRHAQHQTGKQIKLELEKLVRAWHRFYRPALPAAVLPLSQGARDSWIKFFGIRGVRKGYNEAVLVREGRSTGRMDGEWVMVRGRVGWVKVHHESRLGVRAGASSSSEARAHRRGRGVEKVEINVGRVSFLHKTAVSSGRLSPHLASSSERPNGGKTTVLARPAAVPRGRRKATQKKKERMEAAPATPPCAQSLKGVSGDVIVLEEAAYCDPGLISEVIVPCFQCRSRACCASARSWNRRNHDCVLRRLTNSKSVTSALRALAARAAPRCLSCATRRPAASCSRPSPSRWCALQSSVRTSAQRCARGLWCSGV